MTQLQACQLKTRKMESIGFDLGSQEVTSQSPYAKYGDVGAFFDPSKTKEYLNLDEVILLSEGELIEDSEQKKRLKNARRLMDKLEPEKLELVTGDIKKLDEDLLLEKTDEGFIIYQII